MAYKRISPVPVVEGGTSAQTLTGVLTGNGTSAITANTVTANGVVIGGSSNAVSSITVGLNGYVLIGASAAAPAFAALTSTGGTVVFTTGANSLNLEASGDSVLKYTGINHASSPYTVLSTDDYISADVTAGVISVLLPNAPATGRSFTIKDKVGLSGTSNITVTTVGGSVTIDGVTSFVMNTAYQSINVVFNGSNYEIY